MNYIKRDIEAAFLQVSKQFKVVLVTGPRQVGKTTMMKKLMEGSDRKYVTLDDIANRSLAKTDPRTFIMTHTPPVFIDEVQYAPELFSYIKMQVDERQLKGDYWLSGSQLFRLMRGVSESLAGRVGLLNFHRFMIAVSARTAQLINYKAIADDADIDQVTVKNWLNILETLGLIFYLHPYSNNLLKRTIKTPNISKY